MYRKDKKGISELLSWVLIIGFAIVLGAFISGWAIKLIKDFNIRDDPELYCDNAQIGLSVCRNDDKKTMNVTVINKGLYNITRLTLNRETSLSPLGSCYILNTENVLGPQAEYNFRVYLGGRIDTFEIQSCPETGLENFEDDVKEISVGPWITFDEPIYCTEKKVSIKNPEVLNRNC